MERDGLDDIAAILTYIPARDLRTPGAQWEGRSKQSTAVYFEVTMNSSQVMERIAAGEDTSHQFRATVYWTADAYRDKEDIDGNLFTQQRRGVDFILRNLHRRPNGGDFNAPGEPEIPALAVREVVANALAHRDYFVDAPVAIDVHPDRVEVISPGSLPNTVTVENIKLGIHLERNPILLSFLAKDPEYGYTGRGSGIPRVLRLCREKGVSVTLTNDVDRNRFAVAFSRTNG